MVRPGVGHTQAAFRFVRASHAVHAAAIVCRVLGVSVSGYHAWRRRPPSKRATSDADLLKRIREIHTMSDGTYGAPRIRAEFAYVDGLPVNIKRIARLMRNCRPTSSLASSRPTRRTSSGWPTSHTSRP